MIMVKQFGYKSNEEYINKTSCCYKIPYIKIPTLFMSTLDDPLVGLNGLDFDSISHNENTVLATNDIGGHLGFHTNSWT